MTVTDQMVDESCEEQTVDVACFERDCKPSTRTVFDRVCNPRVETVCETVLDETTDRQCTTITVQEVEQQCRYRTGNSLIISKSY